MEAARDAGHALLRKEIQIADEASLDRLPEIAQEIMRNALIGMADGYTGEDLPRLIMRTAQPGDAHGNRGLHDNPDTFYRLIPLDGRSDFILEGHASDHPATIFEVSALTTQWLTLGNLTREDLGIEPGSRFRIHFGYDRNPSCTHFIQSSGDAEMLLLRETLADWAVECPSHLTIENRIDRGGARSEDGPAFIASAVARVEKWFSEAVRLTRVPLAQPANVFPPPIISGEHGKLVTMAYSIGHFHIRPGEALVLRIDPGEAQYIGAPITNLWGTTNRNLAENASINAHQATRDADRCFTAVLSHEDPGIAEWLDPDGLDRGFLFLRWAGLDPEKTPTRVPAVDVQVVPIDRLNEVIPASLPRLDQAQRAAHHQTRKAAYARRFREFEDGDG